MLPAKGIVYLVVAGDVKREVKKAQVAAAHATRNETSSEVKSKPCRETVVHGLLRQRLLPQGAIVASTTATPANQRHAVCMPEEPVQTISVEVAARAYAAGAPDTRFHEVVDAAPASAYNAASAARRCSL